MKMEERDYFTDHEILVDPYGFFAALREHGPIYQPPGRDYLVVTGFEESLEILRNQEAFSSIICLQGAHAPLPITPEGSDITAQVERHRAEFESGDSMIALDDSAHTKLRAFINTLFVPSRLKASEAFITDFCDDMVRTAVADGKIDLISRIATPFVTVVVADLLGVPKDDQQVFMDVIAAAPPPGSLDGDKGPEENRPFAVMGSYFYNYITDRRANPQDDILTEFANAKYADGTEPELMELINLAMFLFGAGQDTSAKLLGNSMKFLIADQSLQDDLRANPSKIPAFLEEVLRIEGSTKQTARLARRDVTVGGRYMPAGTKVLIALSAANRDPKRWQDPDELILDRPKIKEHVGFGRGKHVCAGAPLARVEVRIMVEKLLAYTSRIELDPERHPNGIEDLVYEPSWIIRGIAEMHLKLTPAPGLDRKAAA